MAHIAMADIVMAYEVMAVVVMADIVMAMHSFGARIQAHRTSFRRAISSTYIVMAHIAMADVVVAGRTDLLPAAMSSVFSSLEIDFQAPSVLVPPSVSRSASSHTFGRCHRPTSI